MGWLDNSTNNIILDAVLTDYGRQALAKNNGSFNITKFALGDDEVNYGIVTKYGRTIGREKIEKNTPVFEALTNQNLALKYKLVGIPIPLVYYPKLSLSAISSVDFTTSDKISVTAVQSLASNDSNTTIYSDIQDAHFDVYYPSLFLTVNSTQNTTTSMDTLRTEHVVVPSNTRSSTAGGATEVQVTFDVNKKSLANTTYATYGRLVTVTSGGQNSDKYRISTSIKIVGQSSGLTLDIPVTITQQ